MSGVEVAAAAAAVSLVSSGVSAYSQLQVANKSAAMQNQQIREQQVQLRLEENQASIERLKKLQSVLATEEVMLGTRNISAGSGTSMAIVTQNLSDFYADENADKLNYSAKQLALARQREAVYQARRAQVFSTVTGFVKEGANTIISYYGVPSKSLIDASAKGTSAANGINVNNSMGTQSYLAAQRNQFNLNA